MLLGPTDKSKIVKHIWTENHNLNLEQAKITEKKLVYIKIN